MYLKIIMLMNTVQVIIFVVAVAVMIALSLRLPSYRDPAPSVIGRCVIGFVLGCYLSMPFQIVASQIVVRYQQNELSKLPYQQEKVALIGDAECVRNNLYKINDEYFVINEHIVSDQDYRENGPQYIREDLTYKEACELMEQMLNNS